MQERKEAAALAAQTNIWLNLWKVRSPPKVKDLLWRAAKGSLPTRLQLHLKHVDIEKNCPYCHGELESILHCLINCPFVQNCWRYSGLKVVCPFFGSFAKWLEQSFNNNDEDSRQKIASLYWSVWRTRNELVWHNKKTYAASVNILATSMLHQWVQAQNKVDVPFAAFLSNGDGATTWRKPHGNDIKINVDAAIFLKGAHSVSRVWPEMR
ncbi:uncharacterized protein LOC133805540 [Humulus lupulus]|uniref:uncharacterized protein LOC133805540 n=1 Tax=Humulus lupulus TaxID=3486 RepID=UPI002B4108A4|nr:uncharacterized protein LOC133805540 [Humulus lupulus]